MQDARDVPIPAAPPERESGEAAALGAGALSSAPAPMAPPIGYSPSPPRRRSRRGWLIAAAIAGVLLLAFVGLGVWAVVLLMDTPAPFGGDAVAVIHIDGAIVGVAGDGFGGVVTPMGIIDLLDRAEEDDSVKAVLLRIDSPGGTAAASQEIASQVERMTKPVVASVGDVAASGAYMIAAQCDEIVASPDSSVGSIGVIMQIPTVDELLDKLGVRYTILKQGKHKDIGSPFRPVTPEERALLDAQMKVVHELFISDVARGRDMPVDKVRSLATGLVWVAAEGKKLGLVDQLGNYSDAIDRAAELGGIKGEPDIVTFREQPIDDLFSVLLGLRADISRISALAELAQPRPSLPR